MILGIDPGTKGGLAVLNSAGQPLLIGKFDGLSIHETVNLVKDAAALSWSGVCYLEKVGYIKGDGGKGSFTFGKVYGVLYATALSAGLEVKDVYPLAWQSFMQCATGGNKNVSKQRAVSLWPHVAVTHHIADALLIAEYGRRQILGIK